MARVQNSNPGQQWLNLGCAHPRFEILKQAKRKLFRLPN
jgi:hypothetical protein